jgi:uncharacterized protein (TIGR03437 family)
MHHRPSAVRFHRAGLALVMAVLFAAPLSARSRITEVVDNHRRVSLSGHLDPRALHAADQGRVDPAFVLPYVTLALKPSPEQQAQLDQLLARQQDPSSPDYHRWLTPEEYANRFGIGQEDVNKITAWLRQEHLTVISVARGRNWIAFRGTAQDIDRAFGTPIHHYFAEGRLHFANAANPSIPAAFQGVVSALHGLSDFHLRPHLRKLNPHYNTSSGEHELGPGDIATIYDINGLYKNSIDGAGQKLAVAGQTQIKLSDIQQFRTYFGLPANDPQVMLVPNTKDPGIQKGDLMEADLDLEVAGSVARNASVIYVYSADVEDAVQYAIDQDLAPVLSVSYGFCELETPQSDALLMQSWAKQGNAQGITWVASSGDAGAADCVGGGGGATDRQLSVDLPAGIPEVTGLGGSTLNEGSGSYWNSGNGDNRVSAISYIPETSWNDSSWDGQPSASGGGASTYFSKPVWQTGAGVPDDGARDVPDAALSASADHDGYAMYSNGGFSVVGGTSAAAPLFAGMVALLNHYLIASGFQTAAGLGNINPNLYTLAHNSPGAFHDITTGDNKVKPCAHYSGCTASAIGYSAGPGYDQVTGLGSVDVFNLVTAWHASAEISPAAVSMSVAASAAAIDFTGSTLLTATVTSSNGGTPDGTVTFSLGDVVLGTATLSGTGESATGSLNVLGYQLAAGANSITAQYSGSLSYLGASATARVTVASVASGPPEILGLTNGASFTESYAPGMAMSVFGVNLAPATGSALAVPLPVQLAGVSATINGVAAPFYYVSPEQLNLQVPYEVPANSQVVLTINNNGQSASMTFLTAAAAPGIFMDLSGAPVPNTSGARGQVVTLFITGAGAVSPAVATGAAPVWGTPVAELPAPVLGITVTVDSVPAGIEFAGIPWGLAGVMQVNYRIPVTIPTGSQPVVVNLGGISSPPVKLDVTQ